MCSSLSLKPQEYLTVKSEVIKVSHSVYYYSLKYSFPSCRLLHCVKLAFQVNQMSQMISVLIQSVGCSSTLQSQDGLINDNDVGACHDFNHSIFVIVNIILVF